MLGFDKARPWAGKYLFCVLWIHLALIFALTSTALKFGWAKSNILGLHNFFQLLLSWVHMRHTFFFAFFIIFGWNLDNLDSICSMYGFWYIFLIFEKLIGFKWRNLSSNPHPRSECSCRQHYTFIILASQGLLLHGLAVSRGGTHWIPQAHAASIQGQWICVWEKHSKASLTLA